MGETRSGRHEASQCDACNSTKGHWQSVAPRMAGFGRDSNRPVYRDARCSLDAWVLRAVTIDGSDVHLTKKQSLT